MNPNRPEDKCALLSKIKAPHLPPSNSTKTDIKSRVDDSYFHKEFRFTPILQNINEGDGLCNGADGMNGNHASFLCSLAGFWAYEAMNGFHLKKINAQELATFGTLETPKNNCDKVKITAGQARGNMAIGSLNKMWTHGSKIL